MRRIIIILALIISSCSWIRPSEYIKQFHSDITINHDASLNITETIVYHTDIAGKHGIVRAIPVAYQGPYGTNYHVSLTFDSVLRDNDATAYHTRYNNEYITLYIGSEDTTLRPGTYTYTITYTTYRQLGFFPEHDELYWNITGTQWTMPIHTASATIHVPNNVPSSDIRADAYTGEYLGVDNRQSTTSINTATNIVRVTTPYTLSPGEGVTVSVAWPKGYITRPPWWHELYYTIRDNWILTVWILHMLALCVYYAYARYVIRRRENRHPIIPQFHPPQHVSPGALDYILRMHYAPRQMGAELVAMAVNKVIQIEHTMRGFKHEYILHKDSASPEHTTHNTLYTALFTNKHEHVSVLYDMSHIHHATQQLQTHYHETYHTYFQNNYETSIFYPLIVGIPTLLILSSIPLQPHHVWHAAATEDYIPFIGLCMLIIMVYGAWLLQTYTDEGLQLRNHILGFKMFLATTESERLAVTSTPPTKTPQLYETYLPYAIALGVEDAWTQQFASIFRQRDDMEHPRWYRGTLSSGRISTFTQGFTNSLQSAYKTQGVGHFSSGAGSGTPGGGRGGGGGSSW